MHKKRIWLITKRLEKNMTQTDVAKELGISNRAVSDYELGKRTPTGKIAYRLSKLLDFDMELFYKDQDQNEAENVSRKRGFGG